MAIDWRKSELRTINIGEDMAPTNWGAKCIFVKNLEKSGIFLENLENAPFLKKKKWSKMHFAPQFVGAISSPILIVENSLFRQSIAMNLSF